MTEPAIAQYTPTFGFPGRTPWPRALGGVVWMVASGLFVANIQFPATSLSARAAILPSFEGLFPGVDVGFLIANSLFRNWSFDPATAMLASSFAALPFLFALILRTTPDRQNPLGTALWIAGNPLCWCLVWGGLGWSALGFYGLWRLMADLPQRPPHSGMPLAGVGIGAAYLFVPYFGDFFLPLAVTLWLVPPRQMLTRHMRVFYLLSFVPLAMIWFSFAYADWLFVGGFEGSKSMLTGALGGQTPLAVMLVGGLVVAPGLYFGLLRRLALQRLAIVAICMLAIIFRPDPGLLFAALALGQGAMAARWGEPLSWKISAATGSWAAVIALEVLFQTV